MHTFKSLAEHVVPFVQAGAITGFLAAFTEAPIDFYKSQLQVQVIRAQADPNYKREFYPPLPILQPMTCCTSVFV